MEQGRMANRNFAQAAATQAQNPQGTANDVMRLRRAVDARFDQSIVAVARGMQSDPLSGMLPRSAHANQVRGRAAGGECSGEACREPSSAISQRIARSSTKLPAVAHHRWGTAIGGAVVFRVHASRGIALTRRPSETPE
jgi:hypothetical protein